MDGGTVTPVVLAGAFPQLPALASALRRARLTVAVAESCTAGLLGAALTALPGSSDYMRGGVIAYADAVKADLLGVSRHDLTTHGAVSEPVARAMAEGVRQRCGAAIGIAVTGVAGPSASRDKPAGLIYVCLAGPAGTRVRRIDGDHGREANRTRAVQEALSMCLAAALTPPPTG